MKAITAEKGVFAGLKRAEAAEGWKWEASEVGYNGKKITLPNDPAEMPIENAIEHLQRLQNANATASQPMEFIKCFPFDGLVAFKRALEHLFGWASAEMIPSMFGPTPPKPISVQVGHRNEDFMVVPMGEFSLPALPKDHRVGINFSRQDNDDFGINIYAKTTRQFENVVREIARTTREYLDQASIYKGKAFRLFIDGDSLDLNHQPEFFDTGKIKSQDLHLNHEVLQAVETSIFTPIKHTDKCRRFGVPLKRGVLLEGPYGVGKSLISTITSQVSVNHGWTFITIDNPSALADTLNLARQYQPCVVFCEDIDRAVSLERDDSANEILNIVDGILSKATDVMVVFTTNHVERISKAMLRPGRLDAVISIRPPDAVTIAKLIYHYGKGVVDPAADLSGVCEILLGQIPATIREVVERSKLHSIPRMDEEGGVIVTADDLQVTALTMTRHLELLNAEDKPEDEAADLLAKLGDFMLGGGNQTLKAVNSLRDQERSHSNYTRTLINDARQKADNISGGVGAVKGDTDKILKKVGA